MCENYVTAGFTFSTFCTLNLSFVLIFTRLFSVFVNDMCSCCVGAKMGQRLGRKWGFDGVGVEILRFCWGFDGVEGLLL